MPLARRFAPLALLSLLALVGGPAFAEDAPDQEALDAAKKIRAKLPDPKDVGSLSYEGDLVIAGENAGSVRFVAEPAVHEGQSVWEIGEDVAQDFGGSRSRHGVTLVLKRDLTLLSGEVARRSGDASEKISFERTPEGFAVERKITTPDGAREIPRVVVPAPEGATYGRMALLLFLRGSPKKAGERYALPWFIPEEAGAPRGEHDPAPTTAPAVLEVTGGGTFGEGKAACDTWAVAFTRGGRSFDLHLDPKDRTLVGILGKVPPVLIVPQGTAPAKAKVDDDAPARTWKAAFLKFGHGYHMGVEKWLDEAFHWESMHAHESSLEGGWPKARPVSEFRRAWLDEFLKASPRRTRAAADELLAMTLATGTVRSETEDAVVFAAHPEFGGGVQRTYYLRRIDGVWYLVRIDEAG